MNLYGVEVTCKLVDSDHDNAYSEYDVYHEGHLIGTVTKSRHVLNTPRGPRNGETTWHGPQGEVHTRHEALVDVLFARGLVVKENGVIRVAYKEAVCR